MGTRLYEGAGKLQASLAGSVDLLDGSATACLNCHGPAGLGSREAGAVATDIRQRSLRMSVRRRGGPPSRYDRAAFCAALRRGQDPAGVVLAKAMPRYRINENECQSLWNYLDRLPAQ